MNKNDISQIPKDERPYEKIFKKGAEYLDNYELIAVLLRSGTHNNSVIDIAKNILKHPLVNNDIENLHRLGFSELSKISGIGKIRSAQFIALMELSRRISKAQARKLLCFSNPQTIADYFMEDMRHLSYEKVIVVFLNARGDYIGDKEIFKGTATASLASAREVFIEALKHDAVNIVFLHNHPSGDPSPSKDDWILTENLINAGKLMQIPLIDHIIIGNKRYYSFREKGCLF